MSKLRIIAILVLASFCVSPAWSQARYDNPADGKSYLTEGEFKTYYPIKQRDTTGQKVVTSNVRLLTGDPQLEQRVDVQDLANFIKGIEAHAYPILAANKKQALVLLQFNCQLGWP